MPRHVEVVVGRPMVTIYGVHITIYVVWCDDKMCVSMLRKRNINEGKSLLTLIHFIVQLNQWSRLPLSIALNPGHNAEPRGSPHQSPVVGDTPVQYYLTRANFFSRLSFVKLLQRNANITSANVQGRITALIRCQYWSTYICSRNVDHFYYLFINIPIYFLHFKKRDVL